MTETTTQETQLPHITKKLMSIMDELSKLLEEEIPLIASRHYDEQNPLIKRKQELTKDYHATLQSLSGRVTALSVEDRAMLKKKGMALDDLAHRNAETIRLAHSATERLLQVVMDEMRKDLHKNSGYSSFGNMAASEKASTVPVACNRSV